MARGTDGASPIAKLLVANRGEIAIRLLEAAAERGVASVAVHSQDDAASLHVRRADEAVELPGSGPAAYLSVEALLDAARATGADALHPGYGFVSESPELARACEAAGVRFVGPRPETLERFGDKAVARALAEGCGVPVLPGTGADPSLEEAARFLAAQPSGAGVLVKALAGGGGRGMRSVDRPEELEPALERCRREAEAFFGRAAVYLERRIDRARHVEVQIVGDGRGAVVHLGERECTLQRQHQKLVERAPCPSLDAALRERLTAAAVALGEAVDYRSLGTVEFLLDLDRPGDFFFIEANPRLQVEHTVTEWVTGVDLVQTQLAIAEGAGLAELGLEAPGVAAPRGHAVQVRVNMERMQPDGSARPGGGTLGAFEWPAGPGVRVDSFGYVGYATSPRFDSLLAKLVVHVPVDDPAAALAKAGRVLARARIEGVATNAAFLRALLADPAVRADAVHTTWIQDHAAQLVAASEAEASAAGAGTAALAGAQIDASDPLAVLAHGRSPDAAAPASAGAPVAAAAPEASGPPGTEPCRAPLQGTVLELLVEEGAFVGRGQPLLVMEAMKMEHVVEAGLAGTVRRVAATPGATVFEGHPLLFLEPADEQVDAVAEVEAVDLDRIRPDLAEVRERHAAGLDAQRPRAVERRRKTGQRTVRENLEHLLDEGSFREYGPLVIAAQRRRRSIDDLIENTPADGMLCGVGRVNGELFPGDAAQCAVAAYDYTVLAGTQGLQNHRKKDRIFELAAQRRLPLVMFTEGGGGRPGDTDGTGVAGLDCLAFHLFGRLSGEVPLVGVNSGRCFAGNAALLGCCDIVIATENSNIGMGGPAMIEGGGLGIFRPEEVGPIEHQRANGVVDVVVADEREAVEVARRYLAYFQGPLAQWECADQRLLRSVIPENRLRVYDVRRVIEGLADLDSVLELRRDFGAGMVTALARIEGRPLGIVANDPTHLAGAIDAPAADKAARFLQLCDAFDLPVLMLCDTPGIMVGPEAEKDALVRHAARLFVVGASLSVPFFTIVLRKGYGLGAQAMAGGSFRAGRFCIAWPTGEFGGMGLEGAVKLGYRKELEAVADPAERKALFQQMVDRMYAHGKAVNMASHFEIDEVIDPVDSRGWIASGMDDYVSWRARGHKKRACVDTW